MERGEAPGPGPGETGTAATDDGTAGAAGTPGRVAVAVVLYVGARLLLVAAVAAVLTVVGLPLLVALLIAIVLGLPLSLVLFRGLRARLSVEIDAATADRRERRERLRAQLRGEDVPPA